MNSRVTGISIMMKMYNATKPLLAENKVAE